ncbi:MAG TPA: TM2 domain-containing protein [Saprospiraceae bacterium]|nr:TM2 domain-containing protein [Saprospiraceae bacterium]
MKAKFYYLLLIGFVLVFGSCSKSRDLTCPSFKEKRNFDISFDFLKSHKSHSKHKPSTRNVAKNNAIQGFYNEAIAVEGIDKITPSISGLTASATNELVLPEFSHAITKAKSAENPATENAQVHKKLSLKDKAKLYVAKKVVEKQLKKLDQQQAQLSNADLDDQPAGGGKSQLIALLLCVFVGGLGIHRFYLGYTTIGIIQLLTAGGCGIWALIDLIRIITGDLKPKNGNYTETL